MKFIRNYGGSFSSCYFFNDDSSNTSSRCSNSSPFVGQSSNPSNQCSGDSIPDDARSLSAVNLSPLIHTVVSKVSSARNEPK
jgi:hypothetical protein